MPEVTVFVPVYNEESVMLTNCRRLLEVLEKSGLDYEVIVGSNGSNDQTEALGRLLAQRNQKLRFFHLPRCGPGAAFAKAVQSAAAPCLVTLDMDLSVEPEFVPLAVNLLKDYDVVVGSKRQGREERSLVRVLGSWLYIACARLILGLPYDDYSIGAKAFRLEVVNRFQHLIDRHTAYAGNLVYAAHHSGLKIAVVPVHCSDSRSSHFSLVHEALYRLTWIVRLALRGRSIG